MPQISRPFEIDPTAALRCRTWPRAAAERLEPRFMVIDTGSRFEPSGPMTLLQEGALEADHHVVCVCVAGSTMGTIPIAIPRA